MLKELIVASILSLSSPEAEAETPKIEITEQQPASNLKLSNMELDFPEITEEKPDSNFEEQDLLLDLKPIKKKPSKNPFELLLTLPTAYISTLSFHEFGHYCIMDKLHYQNIRLSVLENGVIASIPADFPEDFDITKSREHPFVSLAGIAFSTMGNEILTDYLIKDDKIQGLMRKTIAATSLMMMLDRYRYVLSSTLKFYTGTKHGRGDDINNALESMFLKPDYEREYCFGKGCKVQGEEYYTYIEQDKTILKYAYPILAAATIVEIGLRWKEISYLTKTALGLEAEKPTMPVKFWINSDPEHLTFNLRYEW